MSADQYVLSFDFDEILQNVSELQESYALITEEIKKSSSGSSELVDKVGVKLDSAATKLNSSMQSMNTFYTNMASKFTGLVATFKDLDKYSKSITDNLKGLQGVDLSGMGQAADATAAQRIESVSPGSFFSMSMDVSGDDAGGSGKALDTAKKALSAAKNAIEESQKATTMAGKAAEKIKAAVVGEAKGAGKAIGGIARKAMGGAGLKSENPVRSRTASSKRKNDLLPAYDSSPRIMPAHCSDDMAPVPESVSRSMITSSACRPNRLYPARSRAAWRSSWVGRSMAWTEWIRNGSMMVS